MRYNVFDIETGPLPVPQLVDLMPEFEAPKNFKDPEKIEANLKQQEARWIEKAALSATTGLVLAIVVKQAHDGSTLIVDQRQKSEAEILEWFWNEVTDQPGMRWVGFNSNGFDLPFLFRRSLLHGITPSFPFRATRYWDSRFIDLMEVWGCGSKEYIKLDDLCRYVGIGGKTGSGKYFAEMFVTDPKAAIEYLKMDLELTEALMLKFLPWINPETNGGQR
jgi:predicted PolB exonuclease-like 3'-5' exonuclease